MVGLAIVAAGDPLNVGTWSGTPFFMTKALQKVYPDLLPVRVPWPKYLQIARKVTKRLTRDRVDLFWNMDLAKRVASKLAVQLEERGIGVAFCIGNAPFSAYISKYIPTIHVSDATVPLMGDYYSEFKVLSRALLKSAYALDKASVLGSEYSLFSTKWAATSAVKDYGATPSKVHAIPWGANIETSRSHINFCFQDDICHLVFIGVDWTRKGGSIAVDAAETMAMAGRPVRLHVIGPVPKGARNTHTIRYHGFIDKSTLEGFRKFDRIMNIASFIFVPTRQDCSPMIFPEAGAYGVPAISTRTGGIPEIVQEGVNGYLLGLEATGNDYGELIWKIWSDQEKYRQLRLSSRYMYETVFNWDRWVSETSTLINSLE